MQAEVIDAIERATESVAKRGLELVSLTHTPVKGDIGHVVFIEVLAETPDKMDVRLCGYDGELQPRDEMEDIFAF